MISKQEIENFTGLKVRRGFDILLPKAIEYLNTNIENVDECRKVIQFVNTSNTKLSKSYYVLRTNLLEEEYIPIMEKCKEDFIQSSYSNTTRRSVATQTINRFYSRGYSGWVIFDENKFYCRSSAEFVYIYYLIETYPLPEFVIKKEPMTYYYQEVSYRPDFLIYRHDKLVKIIEIKSNKKGIDDKVLLFAKYFKEIGIDFECLYSPESIMRIYPYIKTNLKEWQNNVAGINCDMRGENNPAWHRFISDETRKKISDGVKKKITNDPTYQDRRLESLKKFWQSEDGNIARQHISQRRIKIAKEARRLRDLQDPNVEDKCIICNSIYTKRSIEEKGRRTCRNNSCTFRYNVSVGITNISKHTNDTKIKIFKTKIINTLKGHENFNSFDDVEVYIQQLKKSGVLALHQGASKETLIKYFITIEQLNKEINNNG